MPSLFISYAHRDMQPIHWLDRLSLYLDPGDVKPWHDGLIQPGEQWRTEIDTALKQATATILLVGPGFLASEFIANVELPLILEAAKSGGTRVYPLVVGYCRYAESRLGLYQAFNDPERPLESLELAEQNRLLNELSRKVGADIRLKKIAATPVEERRPAGLRNVVMRMAELLDTNHTAFVAQAHRRDDLYSGLKSRLKVKEQLEYEKFFYLYHPQMNEAEGFDFKQIRAMTDAIQDRNREVLTILNEHPELLEEIGGLRDLRQHLVFWLNKYDRVFVNEPKMSVLYTGVEDKVPFPEKVDQEIKAWMRAHP
jgi:TIR domain